MGVRWRLGTVGFGYKQWVEAFYPAGMKSADYLSHYARFFDSAEIDTTFYGTPKAKTVANWYQRVPDDFVFCPKTPHSITHDTPLRDAIRPMREFVFTMQKLEEKLGAILIQYPPSVTLSAFDDLRFFLDGLPDGVRYAIEFRDASWRRGRVLQALNKRNIAWVGADYIHLPPEVLATTDFTYIRFIGIHGQFKTKDHEILDQSDRLKMWHTQLQPHLDQLTTVYGYFNNDYSGHSPTTCNRFKQLIGLPHAYPQIAKQPALF